MLNIIKAVGEDLSFYVWPLTKRNNAIRVLLILAALFVGTQFLSPDTSKEPLTTPVPVVRVGTVSDLSATDSREFVGTVRAVSEAAIKSEGAGRITSVSVKAGDTVAAGSLIASIENSAERAAVLQAQGAYEAALAAQASSRVSVEDAQNDLMAAKQNAVTVYKQAYNTAYTAVIFDIDRFFSNPRSQIPGVRIDVGNAPRINDKRIALEANLTSWENSIETVSSESVETELSRAITHTRAVIELLDIFISNTSSAVKNETLDGVAVSSFAPGLIATRASLQNTVQSLEATGRSITTAEDVLRKAQIGATNPDLNAADAQVKQALGSLRAAQSRLFKTIMRTPISGTVNILHVNTGDFVSAFAPIAEIANNGSLEVSIFAGENDLASFEIGQTVKIEGRIDGTVVNISPAIDPNTLKTEIKIATDDTTLTNGSSVAISLTDDTIVKEQVARLLVPINAIKFVGNDSFIFTVEDNRVRALPITYKTIQGTQVEIESGIDVSTRFIFDARGLYEGQEVTITN